MSLKDVVLVVIFFVLLVVDVLWNPIGLLLLPIIFIHEMGHLLAALAFGLPVKRFAVGLIPVITLRYKKIEWRLGILPFIGYVELGSLDEEDEAAAIAKAKEELEGFEVVEVVEAFGVVEEVEPKKKVKLTFRQKWDLRFAEFEKLDLAQKIPAHQRIVFEGGGVALNFLTAVVVLWISYGLFGERTHAKPLQVAKVNPGAETGLQVGDKILTLDGQRIYHWSQLDWLVKSNTNPELTLEIERAGKLQAIVLKEETLVRVKKLPIKDHEFAVFAYVHSLQIMGSTVEVTSKARDFFRAFERSIVSTGKFALYVTRSAPALFVGEQSIFGIEGPHSTVSDTVVNAADSTQRPFMENYLLLAASLSILLGVLNLIPLPPLDGGRLMFSLLEWLGWQVPNRIRFAMMVVGTLVLCQMLMYAIIFPILIAIF